MKFSYCILFLGISAYLALADRIKLDPVSRQFVDEAGRQRIFHGVNAVYKEFPWYPKLQGFTPQTSLSSEDIANLTRWGFNAIRLGVMWPGVAPIRGQFNETYLSIMEQLVHSLGKAGIYTLVDAHQDIYHRSFCGEGVPDWAVVNSTLAFPRPALGTTKFKDGPDGFPLESECLKHNFGTYYNSEGVSANFGALYANGNGIRDEFAAYWTRLAEVFSASEKILGYELLNEPWVGNFYSDASLLVPGVADRKNLQPFYQLLHKAIRRADDERIIFFEKALTEFFARAGFNETPGGPLYNDRQALSYHDYCGPIDRHGTPKFPKECLLTNKIAMGFALDDAAHLGIGGMMTEFGAMINNSKSIVNLNNVTNLADEKLQSWIYWQFKNFHDITTGGDGESFYTIDGALEKNKVKALSRTYAQACAGAIQSMSFDPSSGLFKLEYAMNTTIPQPTEIYMNEEWYYPQGINVTLFPPNMAKALHSETNKLEIIPTPIAPQGTLLSVTIAPM